MGSQLSCPNLSGSQRGHRPSTCSFLPSSHWPRPRCPPHQTPASLADLPHGQFILDPRWSLGLWKPQGPPCPRREVQLCRLQLMKLPSSKAFHGLQVSFIRALLKSNSVDTSFGLLCPQVSFHPNASLLLSLVGGGLSRSVMPTVRSRDLKTLSIWPSTSFLCYLK